MTSDPENVRDEEIETTEQDVPAPSGASDTGVMMDSRDTGALDRTDVGELGDGDADESDR